MLRQKIVLSLLCMLMLACDSRQHSIENKTTTTPKIICLQPFKGANPEYVRLIQKNIANFYGYEVMTLAQIDAPTTAFVNVKSPRYRADSLLIDLWRRCPNKFSHILGVAPFDISTTKRDDDGNIKKPISKYTDFGIYGLGYCPGKSCVVSYFRLLNANKEKTQQRIIKVALHELGHNLGLPHCPDAKCFMQDARESMKTIDNVGIQLCAACREQIK
jgi:archaemetzincin